MSAPTHSKPVRLAGLALHHALSRDWPKVEHALNRLNAECGGVGIGIALRGWIDTYIDHSTGGDMDAVMPKITPINVETGSSSRDGMPPHVDWAMRLIAARGALDHEAYQACIDELPADDGAVIGRHVTAVLQCVARTINGLPRGYARMGRGGAS